MSQNIVEEISEPKKKRGRKPKQNIINNDNPIYSNNLDNMIINIPIQNIKYTDVEPNNYDEQLSVIENEIKNKICWNCCHDFHQDIVHIPLKIINKYIHSYGYFCSFECAARFITDNIDDKNKYEYLSLLNYYYNLNKKTINKKISVAPSKYTLNIFGGDLSIDEYRNNFTKENIYSAFPIIYHDNDIIVNNTKKNKYKLSRTK